MKKLSSPFALSSYSSHGLPVSRKPRLRSKLSHLSNKADWGKQPKCGGRWRDATPQDAGAFAHLGVVLAKRTRISRGGGFVSQGAGAQSKHAWSPSSILDWLS